METIERTTTAVNPVAPKVAPKEPAGVIKEAINKSTKDLALAAAFHVEGCKFLEIDKSDRTRMVFWFEGGENADRVEREWYQGTLINVLPLYAASSRAMKSLIHS